MPVTLIPFSRREFLRATVAAGAACWSVRAGGAAEDSPDPHRFALFSDTHVWAKREEMVRGANMAANLTQTCREALEGARRPASVLVCGDCAYLSGESADYAVLVELLKPLRDRGVPIHLALGNHDHRQRFWDALPADSEDKRSEFAERHVTLVRAPRANWFILDSLDETNKTPGVLGDEQRQWLAKSLDAFSNRPALVMVHHNPDERPKPGGLVDTAALFELLVPRKHVKALFYGHSHTWNVTQRDGLHLINLPPTAYVFENSRPNGWVDVSLSETGARLQLNCLDPTHAQHRQVCELPWRA